LPKREGVVVGTRKLVIKDRCRICAEAADLYGVVVVHTPVHDEVLSEIERLKKRVLRLTGKK
jgi:hypothetical protein